VGIDIVGGGVVPKREPQAERPRARNNVKIMGKKRGAENIASIIPIKNIVGAVDQPPLQKGY
jgi:hypothetical protein